MLKRWRQVVVIVLLAVLPAVLVPVPAHAAPAVRAEDPPFIVMRNDPGNLCLDDSFEEGLRLFTCHGHTWQRWDVHVIAIGVVAFQNQATRRCLDVVNVGGGMTKVTTSPDCHHTTTQLWNPYAPPNVSWFLILHVIMKPCLARDDLNVSRNVKVTLVPCRPDQPVAHRRWVRWP